MQTSPIQKTIVLPLIPIPPNRCLKTIAFKVDAIYLLRILRPSFSFFSGCFGLATFLSFVFVSRI